MENIKIIKSALLLLTIFFTISYFQNAIAAPSTKWSNVTNRTIITGKDHKDFDPNKVKLMKGDSKLLGLDSQAKQFLKSRYSRAGMGNNCIRNADKAINGLDTKFARCAAKFLKSWEGAGNGRVKITAAFRDASDQYCVCGGHYGPKCAPPGRSKHQRGLAIDVYPANHNHFPRFHSAAKHFGGVHFPLGMRDRPHLTPSGGGCMSGDGGSMKPGSLGGGAGQPSGGSENPYGKKMDPKKMGGQSPSSGGGSGGGKPKGANNQGRDYKDRLKDLYKKGIFGDTIATGTRPQTSSSASTEATLSCAPGQISQGDKVFVKWNCPQKSTRSRGGTTNPRSKFNTTGRVSGRGYARPHSDTGYKIQCLNGSSVISEATCDIRVGNGGGEVAVGKPRLYLAAKEKSIGQSESTMIKWKASNAYDCTLKGGGKTEYGNSGLISTGPLYHSAVYILSCDSALGTIHKKVKVSLW